MDLKTWIKSLSAEDQERFFRQAAKFFSNPELMSIIENVYNGSSLYQAHLRAGVIDRYSVDLNNIRNLKNTETYLHP